LPPRPATSEEGFATLTQILALASRTKVIILSGQEDKKNSLRAVGEGACDFLSKPPDLTELKMILKRVFHVAQLETEYRSAQQEEQEDAFEA